MSRAKPMLRDDCPDVAVTKHLRWSRHIRFGAVRTAEGGVSVGVLLDRALAGESVDSLAADYEIPRAAVSAALEWVRRLVDHEERRLALVKRKSGCDRCRSGQP